MVGLRESADKKSLLAARSRSGSGWTRKSAKIFWHTELGGGATKGTFREAAIQDGLQVTDPSKAIVSGGVTEYGEANWRELFAESFRDRPLPS